MDERDAELIRLIQTDARLSSRELARRLGISPSTCLERLRSLTRRGVIKGYHADIDLPALNRGTQAFVAVVLRLPARPQIDSFKAAVGGWREVLSLSVVSGEDDFVLHVAVQDPEKLHAFLVDRLAKRKEIARFRTTLIFERTENVVVERLEGG